MWGWIATTHCRYREARQARHNRAVMLLGARRLALSLSTDRSLASIRVASYRRSPLALSRRFSFMSTQAAAVADVAPVSIESNPLLSVSGCHQTVERS